MSPMSSSMAASARMPRRASSPPMPSPTATGICTARRRAPGLWSWTSGRGRRSSEALLTRFVSFRHPGESRDQGCKSSLVALDPGFRRGDGKGEGESPEALETAIGEPPPPPPPPPFRGGGGERGGGGGGKGGAPPRRGGRG